MRIRTNFFLQSTRTFPDDVVELGYTMGERI